MRLSRKIEAQRPAHHLAATMAASLATTVTINGFVALAIGLSVAFAFIRGDARCAA